MNKQSLYVLGGALLASTALSTASHAVATIKTPVAVGEKPAGTAVTARRLATQLFGTSATANAAHEIGGQPGDILIDFALPVTVPYRVQINITGAEFTGTATAVVYTQDSTGTSASLAAGSATGCTVNVQPDKLLILGCTPTGQTSTSRVDAMLISGLRYTNAAGLATANTSITLSGFIGEQNGGASSTFDTITAAAVVTSKSAVDAAVDTGATATIDNSVTPAFSKLTSASALSISQAILGTIKFSATSAVGTDLSYAFTSASMASTSEVKITHSVLTDDALVAVSYDGGGPVLSRIPSNVVSGTLSFTVPGASLNGGVITVRFDGSTLIDASTGTSSATVTTGPIADGSGNVLGTLAGFTGNLGTLSRGGLSVEVNSLYPTAGEGSTKYRSFIRVANTSTIGGAVTFTVKDDATGATLGSFSSTQLTSAISAGLLSSTGELRAGSTLQIGSADIEALVPSAATSGHLYKVIVSGAFNGYVQNLMWNSVDGLFSDLSGFRNGALTLDP